MQGRWIVVAAACLLASCSELAASHYRQASDRRIKNVEDDYEVARSRHDAVGMCARAGMVVTALDEAQDAVNARAWRAARTEDCALAKKTIGSFWDDDPAKPPPAPPPP